MKTRSIIVVLALAIFAILVGFLATDQSKERDALIATERALQEQGFKLDLNQFDFSTPAETRDRMALLAISNSPNARFPDRYRRLAEAFPNLMLSAGPHSCFTLLKDETLFFLKRKDLPDKNSLRTPETWQELNDAFENHKTEFDHACLAVLSGPIACNLQASDGTRMVHHHPTLQSWTQLFGTRAMLYLKQGQHDPAWSNLLAAVRLATAHKVEPSDISHFARVTRTTTASDFSWQALQAASWTDAQLATLQHEWESADWISTLPETAAFARASLAAECRHAREQAVRFSLGPKDFIRSPRQVWSQIRQRSEVENWRKHGSYVDEKGILLHLRDTELKLRNAIQLTTWSDMRQLPRMVKPTPFSNLSPSLSNLLNVEFISRVLHRQPHDLLSRIATAETRRRIVVTAIALHRYRAHHGAYPPSLNDLSPELLRTPPIDFMDGKPLRYKPTADSHFLLYSVGLDCSDDGGIMPCSEGRSDASPSDLVWPIPADAPVK